MKYSPSYPPQLTPAERRANRYRAAEEALSASAKHAKQEPTPVDLQIRTLKQTAALLNYYALEAQSDVTRLRSLLRERNVDEEEYEAARVKRWLQEKREQVLQKESGFIQTQVQLVSSGVVPQSDPEDDKFQRNLKRFIVGNDKARRRVEPSGDCTRRVVTRRNVSPMRLQNTAKARRTDFRKPYNSPSSRKRRPRISQKPNYSFPLDDDNVSISSGRGGRVTIYRTSLPKPAWNRESVMLDLPHTPMPSYAQNLLDHFDEQSGSISLPLRRFSTRRSKPIQPPPTLPPLDLSNPTEAEAPQPTVTIAPAPTLLRTSLEAAPAPERKPSSKSSFKRRSRPPSSDVNRPSVHFESDHSVWDFFSKSSSTLSTPGPNKLVKRQKKRSFFGNSESPSALALLISRPKALRRPSQTAMGTSSRTSVASASTSDIPEFTPKMSLQLAPPTQEEEELYREAMSAIPSPPSTPTRPGRASGRGLAKRLSQVELFGSPIKELRRAKSFRDLGFRRETSQATVVTEET